MRGVLGRSPASFILCIGFALGVWLIAGHAERDYFDGLSLGLTVLAFVIPFAIVNPTWDKW